MEQALGTAEADPAAGATAAAASAAADGWTVGERPPDARPRSEARTLSGGHVLCEALIRAGVEIVFGIPGGAIMPFYHALPEYRDRLRHVLCRHEQGAGHAAEGYARASGRVGVCVATSGPGATNLVTALADAHMDGTPIVAITGQVQSPLLGTDAFQETDILGITIPITKHGIQVTRVDEIEDAVREAFEIATAGRPGPVVVDVTKDALQARTVGRVARAGEANASAADGRRPRSAGAPAPDPVAIRAAAALLAGAERPLILAGGGVIWANACAELRDIAERTGIPVVTTLQGKGAFPDDHPLSLGMPGMHGWVHVNRAIQECDVLLNVGSRFDDRVTGKAATFAPRARIVHVDIEAAEIGKVVRADVAVVADARAALLELASALAAVDPEGTLASRLRRWRERIAELRARHEHRQLYRRRPRTCALMPHDVYESFAAVARRRGRYRVVTDVGQHQMWAAQLLEWREPRTHITSGGAGTMGFSVPAALGAALACPDETIWVICGDGGFQMTNQEIATLVQEDVRNVKIAIINNGYLGMVRQWQELFEGRRYSETPLSGPDFSLLARAYGVHAVRVEQAADAEPAIEAAWEHDGVVVLDFRVEREANVFPIVPQGCGIDEMMIEGAAC